MNTTAGRRVEGARVAQMVVWQRVVCLLRLLDNTGGDGADRARALITSPSGTAQHAGYEAHLNRTEFTDLVNPTPNPKPYFKQVTELGALGMRLSGSDLIRRINARDDFASPPENKICGG